MSLDYDSYPCKAEPLPSPARTVALRKASRPRPAPGEPVGPLVHTIVTLVRFPHLRKWYLSLGEDDAHDEIVRQWIESPAIQAKLPDREARAARYLMRLLDAATERIESDDERLRDVWNYVVTTAEWKALPEPARWLYRALHAKAAYPGRYGGPRVLMSHRLAVKFIVELGGREYTPRTMTAAMKALTGAGLATVDIGASYHDGNRPASIKATEYDLLPSTGYFTKLSRAGQLCEVDSRAAEPRPRLAEEAVEQVITGHQADPEAGDRKAAGPEPEPVVLSPEFEEALFGKPAVPSAAVPDEEGAFDPDDFLPGSTKTTERQFAQMVTECRGYPPTREDVMEARAAEIREGRQVYHRA
jgi:hypothetical protein